MQPRAASMALIQWRLLFVVQLLCFSSLSFGQMLSDLMGSGSGMDATDLPFVKPPDQEDGDVDDDVFPFDHETVNICNQPPLGM